LTLAFQNLHANYGIWAPYIALPTLFRWSLVLYVVTFLLGCLPLSFISHFGLVAMTFGPLLGAYLPFLLRSFPQRMCSIPFFGLISSKLGEDAFWINPLRLVRMPKSLVSHIKSCHCSVTLPAYQSRSSLALLADTAYLYTANDVRLTLFKGGTAHHHHLLSRQALRFPDWSRTNTSHPQVSILPLNY